MSDNVIKFPEPITADETLENNKGRFQDVMIVGYDEDGDMTLNGNVSVVDAYVMFATAMRVLMDGILEGEDAIH